MPTLVAAAGEPNVKDKLLAAIRPPARPSRSISTATTSATCGRHRPGKRQEFFYWTDDGDLVGARTTAGSSSSWSSVTRGSAFGKNPFTPLRFPKLFDLRADPFEEAQIDGEYSQVAGRAHVRAGPGAGLRRRST